MVADYSKKTQTDNSHLANATSAKFIHLDGGDLTPKDLPSSHRMLRVVVIAKGIAFTVRNGPRVIGNFATTTPEGTYEFGVYCENALRIDGISGSGSTLVVFDK